MSWAARLIGLAVVCVVVVVAHRVIPKWNPPGDKTTDAGVRKLALFAVHAFSVGAGLALLGVPLSALSVVLGGASAGLAFSARDLISSLCAAFVLFVDRPFSLGDTVEIDGLHGKVQEIGTRSTRVRTMEGHTVNIPNQLFLKLPLRVNRAS